MGSHCFIQICQYIYQQWIRNLSLIEHRCRIVGCIKTGSSYCGVSDTVDSDKATITTRSSDPTNPTTATTGCWRTTCG